MKYRIWICALAAMLSTLPASLAAQTTHVVNQVGTSFSPSSLTIEVGDTVRWVWSVGFHTVTNGTGAADAAVGTLFDAPLNSSAPQFEHVFSEAGSVPYFCRPHEIVNMKGTIVVEEPSTDSPPGAEFPLLVHGLSPNPFNPRVSIAFTLGQPSQVTIEVHDIMGRRVRMLANGEPMDAGRREFTWDGFTESGVAVASGVYFFRVRAHGSERVARGVLVR